MALLASSSRAAGPRAAPAAASRALLRPAPLAARGRAIRATISAAAKASAPVKIILQGRRLEVTPAIKEYVEEKITRAVHNYSQGIKHVDVTISARGGDTGTHGARQQKVDVTIHTLRSGVVRVEDAEASLYASIDTVADKVARKLNKMKELAIHKGTWPGRAGPRGGNEEEQSYKEWVESVAVETMTASFDEEASRGVELAHLSRGSGAGIPDTVLRSKVLRVDAMPVDDAIDAMEAVGHAFFLFRDAKSGEVNVVYKRTAGGYGVLVPEPEK
ncbi:MAG: plastid-specific ribosomal protein 1 [Monoraphidium minutum]|nr:MAG: plastid-specific ribosomal protein 1 [Monoraphidium minutum]